ncbi:MAG: hypothetical protein EOP84_07615 [Verrucomicrobiaceae bacterium]|nr:MAG: hypothetical protein EOP84_07615 [Verrucomicrobiaceae bacterium]
MPNIQVPFSSGVTFWFFGLFWVALALLHVLFMFSLWTDAERLRAQGRSTSVLTPFVWGFSALLLGMMAVALYWLVHYSRLGRQTAAGPLRG